jgi:hypothetical protein
LEKPIGEAHTGQPQPDSGIALQYSKSVPKEWKSRVAEDYEGIGQDSDPDLGNPSGV